MNLKQQLEENSKLMLAIDEILSINTTDQRPICRCNVSQNDFVEFSEDATPENLQILLDYWTQTKNQTMVKIVEMCLNAHSL